MARSTRKATRRAMAAEPWKYAGGIPYDPKAIPETITRSGKPYRLYSVTGNKGTAYGPSAPPGAKVVQYGPFIAPGADWTGGVPARFYHWGVYVPAGMTRVAAFDALDARAARFPRAHGLHRHNPGTDPFTHLRSPSGLDPWKYLMAPLPAFQHYTDRAARELYIYKGAEGWGEGDPMHLRAAQENIELADDALAGIRYRKQRPVAATLAAFKSTKRAISRAQATRGKRRNPSSAVTPGAFKRQTDGSYYKAGWFILKQREPKGSGTRYGGKLSKQRRTVWVLYKRSGQKWIEQSRHKTLSAAQRRAGA